MILRDHRHQGSLVGGRYIDKKHRIRITTGEYAGEVRHKHEYDVVEFLDNGENARKITELAWSHV
jgi:hypothetical protein